MAEPQKNNPVLFPKNWHHPRYSNCLFWARVQRRRHGGWVAARKTDVPNGWWNHYVWSPDGIHWFEYNPVWPKSWWKEKWWLRWFPPPIFRGVIEEADMSIGTNPNPWRLLEDRPGVAAV